MNPVPLSYRAREQRVRFEFSTSKQMGLDVVQAHSHRVESSELVPVVENGTS